MASFNTPVSSRPPLASTKKAILNFVKGLISKSMYRAFEIVLSPCCVPIATAVAECVDGKYTITVTTASPINLEGKGIATLSTSDGGSSTIYPFTDGQTEFVFTGVSNASGEHKISLWFLLIINQDLNVDKPSLITTGYVYPGIDVDFPVCG